MTGVISQVALLLRQTGKVVTLGLVAVFMAPAFGGVDAKTTYDISGTSTRAKTEYKKAPMDLDANLKDKLWERFQTKLKEMPFVTDVQTGEVTETKDDPGSYATYFNIKRVFSAFIQLSLPKPVTLLVSVEQNHRLCKNPGDVKSVSDESGSSGVCLMNSTLEIKGPISIYGNYETESNLNIADLLRDKQRLYITASRSYDQADLTLESSLFVDSMMFEKSLIKFFDVFSVSTVSKKAEDLTRQSIFLGVARVIRQNNERMLDL